MNLERLIDQFDLITDTEEGFEQIRKVILDQAVRGNLTEQDFENEPADKLLKRIEVEKKRLYDKGEIRKPKDLDEVNNDDVPYSIPSNWEWTKIGEILNISSGYAFKSSQYSKTGDFVLRVSNINPDGTIDTSEGISKYIKPESLDDRQQGYYLDEGDILLVMVGGSLGKLGWVNKAVLPALLNQNMWKINPYFEQLVKEFVFLTLQNINENRLEITSSTHGHLSQTFYNDIPFPLPPLEEQQRIVKKIETLFTQVDELEQKVQQDRQVDDRLQVAVLDDLQRAETPEASRQSWQRLTDHFEQIYRKPDHIDQLKQAILNEAVRGRLVPQDPDDEPANKLLERIKEEKQRLYDEGEIRKPKDLESVSKDEVPYGLPDSWTWSRLGNIYHNWGNKTPDKKFQYIDVSSIDNEKGEIGNEVEVIRPDDAPSRAKRIVKKGTVLYSTVRPYLLNVAIYKGDFEYEPIASTAFEVIHPLSGICNKYIYHYLRSQTFTDYVDSTMVGVAYPAVNKGDMIKAYFPLPPTEEQIRIVKKIEELFSWCDDLKEKLSRFRQTDQRLLEALVNGHEG